MDSLLFLNNRVLMNISLFELFGLVIELFLVKQFEERVKQFEN